MIASALMKENGDDDSSEDAVCPKCGLVYADSGGLWSAAMAVMSGMI